MFGYQPLGSDEPAALLLNQTAFWVGPIAGPSGSAVSPRLSGWTAQPGICRPSPAPPPCFPRHRCQWPPLSPSDSLSGAVRAVANRLKPVGGDGASIGGMLIWCMGKVVHRYVGVMRRPPAGTQPSRAGNSYAGNRRSEPEGWRWENVFGYQPGIRSRQRRAGGAPPSSFTNLPHASAHFTLALV